MAIAVIVWDASALAKRYLPEPGSDVVDALFADITPFRMVATTIGYAETYACLVRARNRGGVNEASFVDAAAHLNDEVLDDLDFAVLSIDDSAILQGIPFINRYNLNATDAAILAVYLRFEHDLPEDRARCVLVSSDRRLLRAAEAEGLKTLNPETMAPADLRAMLASFA